MRIANRACRSPACRSHHDLRRMRVAVVGDILAYNTRSGGHVHARWISGITTASPRRDSALLAVVPARRACSALAACKGGGEGNAEAKDARMPTRGRKRSRSKCAKASRRPIAASYTGTAPLEAAASRRWSPRPPASRCRCSPRKASRCTPARCWCAWIRTARACRPRRPPRRCASWRANYQRVAASWPARSWSAPTTSTRSVTTWKTRARPTAWPTSNCPTPTSSRRSPA